MHIRKDDTVVVIRGPHKGRRGRVLHVDPKKERLHIEGVNMMKKHKKTNNRAQTGGIIEQEAPVHMSAVMAWCEAEQKPSKIVMKRLEDGSRVRTWKINGQTID